MENLCGRINNAREMSEEAEIKEALGWEDDPTVRSALILNENLQDEEFVKEIRDENNGLVIKAIECKLKKLGRMSNQ